MDRKQHWGGVYGKRKPTEVGRYQAEPTPSQNLVSEAAGVDLSGGATALCCGRSGARPRGGVRSARAVMFPSLSPPRLILALSLFLAVPAAATDSPAELEMVRQRLMAWLPGEYDSQPQKALEEALGTPKDLVHGRVYRVFTRIDMKELGEHVLLAQVRYGGKNGAVDKNEVQLFVLTIDNNYGAVRMSPRRIVDVDAAVGADRDVKRLAMIAPDMKAAPTAPAGCDIWWRLHGSELRGVTEPADCRSVSRSGQRLAWEWEFLLRPEELWINFGGRSEDGRLANGRPDQIHWRLYKARDFDCSLSSQTSPGQYQEVSRFAIHDRGDIHRASYEDGGQTKEIFVELIRGPESLPSGDYRPDVLRFQVYEGRSEGPRDKAVVVGGGSAPGPSDMIAFTSPGLRGQCNVGPSTARNGG